MSDQISKVKDVCVVCGAFDIMPKRRPDIKTIKEIKGICDVCISYIPESRWGKYED